MSNFMANFPIGDVQAIGVDVTDTSDLVVLPEKDAPDVMVVNEGTATAYVRVGSIGVDTLAINEFDMTSGQPSAGNTMTIDGRVYTMVQFLQAIPARNNLDTGGPILNGNTVTIGGQVYTFVNTLDAPVHAIGELVDMAPALAGNTVTIGTDVYTFRENLDADEPFDVLLTGNNTDDLTNLHNAINNGPGEGVTYGDFTPKSTFVTAVVASSDTMDVKAIVAGPDGDNINTSADLDGGTFASPFLGLGAFPSAYEVVVGADVDATLQHLSLAVTQDNSVGVNYMYGQGTAPNPDVTMAPIAPGRAQAIARIPGVAGNSITTTAVLDDGDWDTATLEDGADAAAPDDILIGAETADTLANLVAALNAQGNLEGIAFGFGTVINPDVSASVNPDDDVIMDLVAKIPGTAGNAITTTANFISGADFDTATMTGGLDDFGAVEADALGMPVQGGEKGVYNIGKDLLSTNRPLALAFITAAGTTNLSIVQGHGA